MCVVIIYIDVKIYWGWRWMLIFRVKVIYFLCIICRINLKFKNKYIIFGFVENIFDFF